MKKIESLRRRILVLSILAVALAAAWVFRPAEVTTQRTEELPALVEGFTSDQATRISVQQAGSLQTAGAPRKVTLERRATRDGGSAWVVTSAFGYPAGDDKVARLLSEISQAKVASEATRRADAFEQYVQDGAWIEVKVEDTAGKVLAAFGVGKTLESETALRLDTPAPRVVRVRNFAAWSARPVPEAWLETRMFPDAEARNLEQLEIVQRVEVDGQPRTRTILLRKLPQEAAKEGQPAPERGWELLGDDGGPASRAEVEDVARALTGLIFQDVVARSEGKPDAKCGLDAPEVGATGTFASSEPGKPGARIRLALGAKDAEGKQWYARRGSEDWVFTVRDDDYSTGRLRADPAKFKAAPPAPPAAAEVPGAPAPLPGGQVPQGSPDGEPAPGQPK
ncbi:MAG: DUF4340 domain-containing protein [Planctomycetia bacterium]